MKRVLPLLSTLAVLTRAGCASVSPDGLRGDVAQHTQGRLPAGAQLPSPGKRPGTARRNCWPGRR